MDRVFLAQACHKLGRLEEARLWLEKARAPAGETPGKPTGAAAGATPRWNRRLQRQALLREAASLAGI